jgi:hypothetical protein
MDTRQESALACVVQILEPLDAEASVLIVPLGRTAALGQKIPWPRAYEGRAVARKQIVQALRRLTVAASVEVWLEGQTRSRSWSVPYPEPSGLFPRDDRPSRDWVRRWLDAEHGDRGEKAGGTCSIIPFGVAVAAGSASQSGSRESEASRTARARPSPDCWDDVRKLLMSRERRMTCTLIASELARVGLAWGSRSLETVLSEARRVGLLDHDRTGGGYGLTPEGRLASLNEVRRLWGLRQEDGES